MHRRDVVVDGIARTARVDRPLVDDVLVPVLRDVAAGAGGRRRFVFLAAPPATGKSTLAAVLAREAGLPLDVIGIDGFHHPHHYLQSHTTERDGARVPLASVKGAPETYDVAALDRHLRDGATRVLTWPTYDRTLHDVVPAGRRIGADLVLVEGNWLLLGEPGWRDLAEHAAFSIFIDAAPTCWRSASSSARSAAARTRPRRGSSSRAATCRTSSGSWHAPTARAST